MNKLKNIADIDNIDIADIDNKLKRFLWLYDEFKS